MRYGGWTKRDPVAIDVPIRIEMPAHADVDVQLTGSIVYFPARPSVETGFYSDSCEKCQTG